ncbi:hypothetical protein [[Mycobacterium] holstebronense]|uniref:Uncharacterized protein n=1 Tax=[Mycobacterium] holstebronense TaxID=3064288 RepID=A0ABN9NTA9_9MYCO|nr:hypothetical protein [Mycolicibacter sp. MU0102]CAJ1509891.1 hypothetical protein MU0102_003894 [Mycolicibacter sp. MU0102]
METPVIGTMAKLTFSASMTRYASTVPFGGDEAADFSKAAGPNAIQRSLRSTAPAQDARQH